MRDAPMIRRLQGIIIAGVLVIAAFSTGWAFLFYLLYLGDPRRWAARTWPSGSD